MSWLREDHGSIALTAMAAIPILLVVLAASGELGALRLLAARARSAADLAAIVAVNDQDDAELSRSGSLRLADDAADVAREYLAMNLATIGPALADDAGSIAAAATVEVGSDTVRIEASVPLRTAVLGALLGPAVTRIAVRAASAAR